MKTINVSNNNFGKMRRLYNEFYEIYGSQEATKWDLDDLDEMRKIGQEFMEIFSVHLAKSSN